MISVLLTAILLCFLAIIGAIVYAFLKIRSFYRQFVAFITPAEANKPSQLATVFEAFSEMIGRALVASLKGFLMGAKSIEARQANAEARAEVESSPMGALVNMLPGSVKKSLIKNPQLLDLAINFMNRNKSGPGPGNNGTAERAKFNL